MRYEPFPHPCQLYTIRPTTLFSSSAQASERVIELPAWSEVHFHGLTDNAVVLGNQGNPMILVAYTAPSGAEYTGWAYRGMFEHLSYEFDPGCVEVTAEQNWRALPGEMCAAYVLGYDLATVLANYKSPKYGWWQRFTHLDILDFHQMAQLFLAFRLQTESLPNMLLDAWLSFPVFTPHQVLIATRRHHLIMRAWQDPLETLLCPQEGPGLAKVPTWVVVTKITPDGLADGWVELFNPLANQVQRYPWRDLAKSVGEHYTGIVIPSA